MRNGHNTFRSAALLLWTLYLLFPNDDSFHTMGIGDAGGRILVIDIFVAVLAFLTITKWRLAWYPCKKTFRKYVLVVFALVVCQSLVRGIPEYRGLAIGEARWYLSATMLPAFFVGYDRSWFRSMVKITIVIAVWQVIAILVMMMFGEVRAVGEGVERFGGGKLSFVICLGVLVALDAIIHPNRLGWGRTVPIVTGAVMILALIVGQTRSVFLFLPPTIVFYLFSVGRLRVRTIVTRIVPGMAVLVLIFAVVIALFPSGIRTSVDKSVAVVTEAVQPQTFSIVLSGDAVSAGQMAGLFSESGNTGFRVMAWSQVIADVLGTPRAWIWGKAMGSGFYFTDLSGASYVDLDPHNDYISIFSKVGLVGLAAYLVILVRFQWRWLRRKLWYRDTYLPVIAGMIFFLMLFVSTNAEIRSYALHFWMWPLLGMGLREMWEAEHENSRRDLISGNGIAGTFTPDPT